MSSYFLHEKEGSSEGSHGREPGGLLGTTPGGGKRGSFHGRDSRSTVRNHLGEDLAWSLASATSPLGEPAGC